MAGFAFMWVRQSPARAGHQRHAHQAVGAEHAQQLFLGHADRLALALHEGGTALEGALGHRAALGERHGELGDALAARGRRAHQGVAGRVFQQDHGVLEIEQDARGARHRFQQAGFALLARQGLADFGH